MATTGMVVGAGRSPRRRMVVACVAGVLAVALTACRQPVDQASPTSEGPVAATTATSPTPSPPTEEAATTPSRTEPEPTPEGEPTGTTAAARFVRAPGLPAATSGSSPHGSGCAPGPGPLPDGVWFGMGRGLSPAAIEFDLACFYTGSAAIDQAAARGLETPPPNDYLIVNDQPTLRTEPIADDAVAWRPGSGTEATAVTWPAFTADPGPYLACPGDACRVWLYVNGGVVTEVAGQYVP